MLITHFNSGIEWYESCLIDPKRGYWVFTRHKSLAVPVSKVCNRNIIPIAGRKNIIRTQMQVNVAPMPPGPENPYGIGFHHNRDSVENRAGSCAEGGSRQIPHLENNEPRQPESNVRCANSLSLALSVILNNLSRGTAQKLLILL